MQWSVETLAIGDDEIARLPVGLRARLLRLLVTVERVGLDQMREPHVKHLEGKLSGCGFRRRTALRGDFM